jgi:hypothetical protein
MGPIGVLFLFWLPCFSALEIGILGPHLTVLWWLLGWIVSTRMLLLTICLLSEFRQIQTEWLCKIFNGPVNVLCLCKTFPMDVSKTSDGLVEGSKAFCRSTETGRNQKAEENQRQARNEFGDCLRCSLSVFFSPPKCM